MSAADARATILTRIRDAQRAAGAAPPPPSGAAATRDAERRAYRRVGSAPRGEVLARFLTLLRDYRARTWHVRPDELSATIAACCADGLRRLAVPGDVVPAWVPAGVTVLRDTPAQALEARVLDACDAVLTGCAAAIAQTGTIVLDGGQSQGRRALSLVPDQHICVVRSDQVFELVPEAFAWLERTGRTGRPLTLVSGPSATSDIELTRVEGVHGPRRLDVVLVDPEVGARATSDG